MRHGMSASKGCDWVRAYGIWPSLPQMEIHASWERRSSVSQELIFVSEGKEFGGAVLTGWKLTGELTKVMGRFGVGAVCGVTGERKREGAVVGIVKGVLAGDLWRMRLKSARCR